jgi:SAM-dependent methyltransferase
MMRVFVKRGWTMLGSDISFQMRSAQVNALRNNVQVFQTDGVSIPLANQSVDVIWVFGVLKYNLFPAGWRCLHGCPGATRRGDAAASETMPQNLTDPYNPTYDLVRDMYRVLKPSGMVVQCEVWVNMPPSVFARAFREAEFIDKSAGVMRRDAAPLERALSAFQRVCLPRPLAISVGKVCAWLRFQLDDPSRVTGHFKDYCFV